MNGKSKQNEIQYSISQVYALTGVPKSTIRFWEKEFGEFLHPQRTVGGQRRFSPAEVETLKMIDHLVNREGYTLEGVRRRLRRLREHPETAAKPSPDKLGALAETMSEYLLKKVFSLLEHQNTQREKFL